jgi:hypothetical protein
MLKTLIGPYLFHVRHKTAGLQTCGIRRLARTQRKSVHVFLSLVYLAYRTLTTEDCLGVPAGKWAKPEKRAVKQGQSVHKRDLAHSQYRSFLLSSHSQKALSTRRPSNVATGSVPVKRNVSPRRIGFSKIAFNVDNLNIALLMAWAGALNSNWFRSSWTAVPVLFW